MSITTAIAKLTQGKSANTALSHIFLQTPELLRKRTHTEQVEEEKDDSVHSSEEDHNENEKIDTGEQMKEEKQDDTTEICTPQESDNEESEDKNQPPTKKRKVVSEETGETKEVPIKHDADEKTVNTIFIGNIPLDAKKKVQHLLNWFQTQTKQDLLKLLKPHGKVLSLRFRSLPVNKPVARKIGAIAKLLNPERFVCSFL